MRLQPSADGFTIEGQDLGGLLDLEPERVHRLMRNGAITSRFERGEGEDDGRFRLTFIHDRRRVQLIVAADGAVLHRSRTTVAPLSR